MKEQLLAFLTANWKKILIGVAIVAIFGGVYVSGCIKGCNMGCKATQQ